MTEHCSLWWTGCSWGVWESKAICWFHLELGIIIIDKVLFAFGIKIRIADQLNTLFLEILDGISINWVKWNECFDISEILSFFKCLDSSIIDKDSSQVNMSQDICNILISQCIIDWNGNQLIQCTCSINNWPFSSILWENTNKIVIIGFISVVKLLVNDSTTNCMSIVDKLFVSFVLDCAGLTLLDNGSEGSLVCVNLGWVKQYILYGFEFFRWGIYDALFESWISVDSCLSLFLLADRFCV